MLDTGLSSFKQLRWPTALPATVAARNSPLADYIHTLSQRTVRYTIYRATNRYTCYGVRSCITTRRMAVVRIQAGDVAMQTLTPYLDEDPMAPMSCSSRRITVESPARLHLGFVDLNGDLGRQFGSLGLALEDLSTTVVVESSAAFSIDGDDVARAEKYALSTLQAFELPHRLALTVDNAIPEHAGLGSGTQLALAVAAAIAELFGLDHSVRELARITGRGQRSGIGVGVFAEGGFVVDGGRGPDTVVPPLLARFEFPDDWRVVLVGDAKHQGLSGAAERSAFEAMSPMHSGVAADLCRLTLMGVFPALVERNFAAFTTHIAAIQATMGAYFGPCQGGAFTSTNVAEAIDWLRATYELVGVGQSSWGPTGFAFIEGEQRADDIRASLAKRFATVPQLHFSVHRGRNRGAEISNYARTNAATMATG